MITSVQTVEVIAIAGLGFGMLAFAGVVVIFVAFAWAALA